MDDSTRRRTGYEALGYLRDAVVRLHAADLRDLAERCHELCHAVDAALMDAARTPPPDRAAPVIDEIDDAPTAPTNIERRPR